jgi:hypothetical protein
MSRTAVCQTNTCQTTTHNAQQPAGRAARHPGEVVESPGAANAAAVAAAGGACDLLLAIHALTPFASHAV